MNGFLIAGITLIILGYGADIVIFDLLPRQLSRKFTKIGHIGNYVGLLGWFLTIYGAMAINIWLGVLVLVIARCLPALF